MDKTDMKKLILLAVLFLVLPINVGAIEDSVVGKSFKLQSYEANKIGWTFDENDVGYMDFKVSLKYPFYYDEILAAKSKERLAGETSVKGVLVKYLLPIPYLAFTGRFGQYISTRDSSPVIGKRFNPKVFGRFLVSGTDYLDIGYGHESNGQRINSEVSYQDLREDFASNGEDPEFANDYISRGWDYLDLNWKYSINSPEYIEKEETFSTYVNLKFFLKDGLLQGELEESNEWENDSVGKQRKRVDGITIKAEYLRPENHFIGGIKLTYTTGYQGVFENNTVRFETILNLGDFPVMLWISEGYNSDLVDYYRRLKSSGVCLELNSF